MRISEVSIRVRYGETDRMGYCYYGNYAQYFEVGRVEALRELGVSYKELEDDGIALPVSHYSVDYKRPAYYDDELRVITKIMSCEGARIEFEYEVLNQADQLICSARTTLVFVDMDSGRPIKAPEKISSLITGI